MDSVVNSVVNSAVNSVVNSGGRGWGEQKVAFRVHETILWDTSPDPPDPAYPADPPDPVPEPGLGPSLPHAPGARMTVV